MLKFLSYFIFILLIAGLILSSAGFMKKPVDSEMIKVKSVQNGYNTISIKQLDSLSAASNIYFSKLVR